MKTGKVYYLNLVIVGLRNPLKELQNQVQPQPPAAQDYSFTKCQWNKAVSKLYKLFRSRKGTFLERRRVYVDRTGI